MTTTQQPTWTTTDLRARPGAPVGRAVAAPPVATPPVPGVGRPRPWQRRWVRVTAGAVALGVAGWTVAGQLGSTDLQVPAITDVRWALLALIACALSFPAAAAGLLAVSPVQVSTLAAVVTQLASAATKLVTPGSLGVVGLNVRLLVAHGTPLPVAVATVGTSQVAQVLVTVAALPFVLAGAGTAVTLPSLAVPAWWLLLGGAALTTAGVLARAHLVTAWRSALPSLRPLADVLRSPQRLLLAVGGCAALTAALTVCLYACVRAVGGEISVLAVAAVLLVGSALGSALPTPGGLGGVESAMVAAFLAVGLTVAVALPAVLAFRLVSFWLPMPAGVLALGWLRRHRLV